MAIVSYQGVSSSSPHPNGRFIQLARTGLDIVEILPIENYRRGFQNTLATAGRTLKGRVIAGNSSYKPPYEWEIACQVTDLQIELIDMLVLIQAVDKVPITLVDHYEPIPYSSAYCNPVTWLDGSPATSETGLSVGYAAFPVILTIEKGYRERQLGRPQGTGWQLLTFKAEQVL